MASQKQLGQSISRRSNSDKTTTLTLNFLNIATGTKAKADIDHMKIMKPKPTAKPAEDIQQLALTWHLMPFTDLDICYHSINLVF